MKKCHRFLCMSLLLCKCIRVKVEILLFHISFFHDYPKCIAHKKSLRRIWVQQLDINSFSCVMILLFVVAVCNHIKKIILFFRRFRNCAATCYENSNTTIFSPVFCFPSSDFDLWDAVGKSEQTTSLFLLAILWYRRPFIISAIRCCYLPSTSDLSYRYIRLDPQCLEELPLR